MINHAMFADRNSFNDFTFSLKRMCEVCGPQRVRLRNDMIVRVQFRPENEQEHETAVFHSEGWLNVWRLDGSSVQNDSYDIVATGHDVDYNFGT